MAKANLKKRIARLEESNRLDQGRIQAALESGDLSKLSEDEYKSFIRTYGFPEETLQYLKVIGVSADDINLIAEGDTERVSNMGIDLAVAGSHTKLADWQAIAEGRWDSVNPEVASEWLRVLETECGSGSEVGYYNPPTTEQVAAFRLRLQGVATALLQGSAAEAQAAESRMV